MKQRYIKRQIQNPSDVEFFVAHGVPQIFAETLSARGITSAEFPYFCGEDCFHSPFEMKNMQQATETISYLIESGGSVLICGDYDADGLTASSILSLFFTDSGVDNDVLIPTRDIGYGLHVETVREAFSKKFYDLVITVDCGISNREEVAAIQDEFGVEVIVTDHHELPEILPDCICVNPKMGYPFPNLAGAGVAWKLVEALAGREIASRYSALAMIGTIGDLMPLVDENRSIVRMGLANIEHKSLQKLIEISFCSKNLTAADIAMKVSPKINAAGRMGEPETALRVLLSRDKVSPLIDKLIQLNERRKAAIAELTKQADAMCDEAQIRNEHLVFLWGENWQRGILGIAAARYKEKYGYAAVVLSWDDEKGLYVGSARGADDVDLFEAVSRCKDLLSQFGGHKAALGLSVSRQNLLPFKNRLVEVLSESASHVEKQLVYDMDLSDNCNLADIVEFASKLEPLLPQDKMLFRVQDTVDSVGLFGKERNHLSVFLHGGLELKFFNHAGYAPIIRGGADVEGLITLEYNDYNQRFCGIVEDFRLLNSVCFDGFYRLNLARNFLPRKVDFVSREQVVQALSENSVLAVFDDYETYLAQSEIFDFSDFYEDIFFDNSFCGKTVAISPNADYGFSRYKRVVCFCNGLLPRELGSNAEYFCVEPANKMLYDVKLDRDLCVAVYVRLKHKDPFESIHGVYDKFLAGKMDYCQYVAALRVFEELKLVEISDAYTVNVLPSPKVELSQSEIFRCLSASPKD